MKYTVILFLLFFLISCGKKENTLTLDITPENISQSSEYQQQNIEVQKQIDQLNTPTSDYPFFGVEGGVGNIDEIIQKKGMEVTKGNIYNTGIGNDYNFINNYLTDFEKKYSFHNQNETFYYTSETKEKIFEKISKGFKKSEIKKISETLAEITFEHNGKKYFMTLSHPRGEVRDTIDKVLGTDNKTKIYIFSL